MPIFYLLLSHVASCANRHERVPVLRLFPEATTVRTAGGRVHDAVSTLLVLSAVGNLGKKGTIMVVHHTDCGLCNAAVLEAGGDEGIRRALLKELETNFEGVEEVGEGYEEARKLEGMKFGSFVR